MGTTRVDDWEVDPRTTGAELTRLEGLDEVLDEVLDEALEEVLEDSDTGTGRLVGVGITAPLVR